jgi:AAA15 family ATPase/GTPase
MLIKFTVGNFLSFKDKITFSLVANKDSEHREAVFSVRGFKDENRFVKTAAIYGLNASGKSNFIKAVRFFRDFVNIGFVSNSGNSIQAIPVNPFLLSEQTENAPSFFEAEILLEGEKFIYGFEVSQKEIHKEWLYRIPGNKSFFERDKQKFKKRFDTF